jgi:hypothetical protein
VIAASWAGVAPAARAALTALEMRVGMPLRSVIADWSTVVSFATWVVSVAIAVSMAAMSLMNSLF